MFLGHSRSASSGPSCFARPCPVAAEAGTDCAEAGHSWSGRSPPARPYQAAAVADNLLAGAVHSCLTSCCVMSGQSNFAHHSLAVAAAGIGHARIGRSCSAWSAQWHSSHPSPVSAELNGPAAADHLGTASLSHHPSISVPAAHWQLVLVAAARHAHENCRKALRYGHTHHHRPPAVAVVMVHRSQTRQSHHSSPPAPSSAASALPSADTDLAPALTVFSAAAPPQPSSSTDSCLPAPQHQNPASPPQSAAYPSHSCPRSPAGEPQAPSAGL